MSGGAKRGKVPPKPHEIALQRLNNHYLLAPVAGHITWYAVSRLPLWTMHPGAHLVIEGDSQIVFNDAKKLDFNQWTGVFAIGLLVLCVGAARRLPRPDLVSDMAAQIAALHWWHELRLGELPEQLQLPPEVLAWGRLPVEEIATRIRAQEPEEWLDGKWSLGSPDVGLLIQCRNEHARYRYWSGSAAHTPPDARFAQSLVDNAKRALQLAHEANLCHTAHHSDPNSNAAQAKRWLINHFPLLGALLTAFDLVEDATICERMDISVAAIQVSTNEIYINPRRGLSVEESKFVVAHEILHAGLNHSSRREGRDAYLWNVACDFVINDWLIGLNVGVPPAIGMLYDEDFRGRSADEIYLKLAGDLRIRRKIYTFRGDDVDMLDDRNDRAFTDGEEFCRRALMQGLDYHESMGRGLLPAGLVEAIRTLNQPPIPWQVQLAQWIQEHFPLPERKRMWAKPSRRQSTTPDIPRPRFIAPQDTKPTHTFGVIVDTSGSMDRDDLGKAFGAIVAYAQAQEVKEVRLVYCDAQPYDEGFVPIESLALRVRVRGRGGTVLQPAISLLLAQKDFPRECPVLIITDGGCEDALDIKRDHAFLLAPGRHLPFATHAPVFRMK